MRRPVVALVVLIVPGLAGIAVADPAPIRVAAAPGATEPVGPGGVQALPAPDPAPPLAPPAHVLAPPGMVDDVPAPAPRVASASTIAGLTSRHDDDAASERAYAFGTALTIPSGSWSLSWRGPIGAPVGMFGVATGIGDRVEVGVSVLYADEGDGGTVGGGSIKVQLLRSKRMALAVHGTGWKFPDEDGVVGLVGAIVSTCTGDSCSAIISAHVSAMIAAVEDNDQNELPILLGTSMVAGRGSIKLLTELMMMEIEHERVTLGVLGTRIGGRRFALDLGIGFGVGDGGGGAFPMGGLTVRP